MSLIDDYYKQLQTLNQQRGMTGNANQNRGMDASLAEGYLDAQYKNNQRQQQLDLQKQGLALQEKGQNFNQAYQMKNMANQEKSATTSLWGQAIGGAAQLGMQAYGINKRWPTPEPPKTTTPTMPTTNAQGVVENAPSNMDLTGIGGFDWGNPVDEGMEQASGMFGNWDLGDIGSWLNF